MRLRPIAAILAVTALALAACSSNDSGGRDDAKPEASAKATATGQDLTHQQRHDARAAAGIPPEPTGAKRAELLRALAAANPDTVKYEDKAVDAARNQCSAINSGAKRLDRLASQRFTYKGVETTEAQGKQINDALEGIGLCKV
ncbi:hypothetical protein [Streptomyces sp. NPDC001843]|uniref:hypothetical protein n=1 Tax=Streptomyces sp. NPDC001843 TaxID=3364617 RepID=UPI0036A81342